MKKLLIIAIMTLMSFSAFAQQDRCIHKDSAGVRCSSRTVGFAWKCEEHKGMISHVDKSLKNFERCIKTDSLGNRCVNVAYYDCGGKYICESCTKGLNVTKPSFKNQTGFKNKDFKSQYTTYENYLRKKSNRWWTVFGITTGVFCATTAATIYGIDVPGALPILYFSGTGSSISFVGAVASSINLRNHRVMVKMAPNKIMFQF